VHERIYDGRIVRLERLDGRWEVVRHADAVAVLCRDQRGRVAGVWQRRPAIDQRTWEIPAGLIDPGEAPATAAARELAEEVGISAELRPVARTFPSPGFSDELVHLFEAVTVTGRVSAERDPDESLEIEWRDPLATWQAIASGAIASSTVTLLALQLALASDGVIPTAATVSDGPAA